VGQNLLCAVSGTLALIGLNPESPRRVQLSSYAGYAPEVAAQGPSARAKDGVDSLIHGEVDGASLRREDGEMDEHDVVTHDGRVLKVLEDGDPAGRPVLTDLGVELHPPTIRPVHNIIEG
jgi:hypothetical protein